MNAKPTAWHRGVGLHPILADHRDPHAEIVNGFVLHIRRSIAQIDLAFKSAGLIEKIYQLRGADGRMRDVQAGDQVERDTELAVVRGSP